MGGGDYFGIIRVTGRKRAEDGMVPEADRRRVRMRGEKRRTGRGAESGPVVVRVASNMP